MLVIASRFALELMPSSVMLFWMLRWPAPRKLKPMSLVFPARTPGVVLASAQTLRPEIGSSDTARLSSVWDSAARSVCQHGGLRLDDHGLAEGADVQHGVAAHDLVARDLDPGRLERLEPFERNRDRVAADADVGNVVLPGVRSWSPRRCPACRRSPLSRRRRESPLPRCPSRCRRGRSATRAAPRRRSRDRHTSSRLARGSERVASIIISDLPLPLPSPSAVGCGPAHTRPSASLRQARSSPGASSIPGSPCR